MGVNNIREKRWQMQLQEEHALLERIGKVVALGKKQKSDSLLYIFGRIIHAITDLERTFDNRGLLQDYSEEIEDHEHEHEAKIDELLGLSFNSLNACCYKFMHEKLESSDIKLF